MLFQETVGLYGPKRNCGSLRAAFGRKVAEIWAKQPDLQPVHESFDNLLVTGVSRYFCQGYVVAPLLFTPELTTVTRSRDLNWNNSHPLRLSMTSGQIFAFSANKTIPAKSRSVNTRTATPLVLAI